MPDLAVGFLLSSFVCHLARFVVESFVFADGVSLLLPGAPVVCFVVPRIVWLVVGKGRCS